MLRLLLRPLLVILTLGMLVVALFQVAGRVAAALLDGAEPVVNRLLAPRGIHISGLEGDWRMLNPVLRLDRVELRAGRLDGLVVEIDMVESVLRGTLLARQLKVEDVRLHFEKPDGEPWRMPWSGGGAGERDPLPFLRHSSQLELSGTVSVARPGTAVAEVAFSYLGTNRGGRHRHALELRNRGGDCADGCVLAVEYQGEAGLWPLRPARTRVLATAHGFELPKALLGLSPLRIAELDLRWDRGPDASSGSLALTAEQFDMPGDVTLATRLRGAVRGDGETHRGAVREWQVRQGAEVWELPEMAVNADAEGVWVWMPKLDLQRAGQFLAQALSGVGPAERWLKNLNVRGQAHNLRAFYRFSGDLGYALTLDGLAIDPFKGVPAVANAGGELFGFGQGLQLNLNAQDMSLSFPELFDEGWQLPYAQGVVQAWFGRDYFGIRGLNLRADAFGSRAAGRFAMTRPQARAGQRLLMLISTDRMDVAQAVRFVPQRLPEGLRHWLNTGPRGGTLERARLAYQGQFREEPGELGRRMELAAEIRDGRVLYHPDWPEVTELAARFAVAGSAVDVEVDEGRSGGASLGGSRVRLAEGASLVDLALDATTDADDALNFLRGTPISRWVSFVEPDWRAAGPLRLSGDVRVPLAPDAPPPAVRLRADLDGVDVALPGYRLELERLHGSFRYRFPHHVDASGIIGSLFGEPVTVGARTRGERVHIELGGRVQPTDLWQLMDLDDPGLARGSLDYQADLGIPLAEGAVPELTVSSHLDGLALSLPGGYGKPADRPEPLAVKLEFRPDHRNFSAEYRDAHGWVHFSDRLLRGSIGFDEPPLDPIWVGDELVLTGALAGFRLEEVLPDGEGSVAGPRFPPLRLEDLRVNEIGVGDFAVTGAELNGRIGADDLQLGIRSTELNGILSRRGEEPLKVMLETLDVPGGDADGDRGDVLDPAMVTDLPAADVQVDRLTVAGEDYGRWRFSMRPQGDDLKLVDLQARVRGVTVDAPEGLVWHGGANETRFAGALRVEDLAKVLPRWGYAPSVKTESASLSGTFRWAGSPVAVDLLKLRGQGRARAENGHFLEVESGAGALRILSLMNFTAIAKRMSLNFSDVFGRGVSFDELDGRIGLDEGVLEFLEPMAVDGTGSRFRITGTVDLEQGRLNNEMLVTLPVSRSLPWYAAYVALANPLAGLGVLVGERVLRKPLEQFSSAKYRIGGTLDDPAVEFVSVFDVGAPEQDAAVAVDAAAEPVRLEPAPQPEPEADETDQ